MELKECPSCGSVAGTHIERCKFCGTELPRGTGATVVAPAHDPADGQPDDRPSDASVADVPGPQEPAAGRSDTTGAAGDTGGAGGAPSMGRQLQDPVADQPFARPRLAGTPLPAAPTPSGGCLGVLRRLLTIGAVLCVVIAIALVFAFREVDSAETDVLAGKGEWYTFVDPEGAFTIDLPSEPYRDEHGTYEYGTKRTIDGRVGRVQYFIEYWDSARGAPAGIGGEHMFEQMPGILTSATGGTANAPIRTTVGGLPALQFDVDAGAMQWSATSIVTGGRVFLIAIGGPDVAVAAHDRIAASFNPIDPNP